MRWIRVFLYALCFTLTTGVVSFTAQASSDADPYFVVKSGEVNYSNYQTLGNPCYYLISGTVLDLEGNPFTDFVVNIRMLGDLAPVEIGYTFPYDKIAQDHASSEWTTLLPQWAVNYEIWLTRANDGTVLSPPILVETRDCDENVATINFIQIRPLL